VQPEKLRLEELSIGVGDVFRYNHFIIPSARDAGQVFFVLVACVHVNEPVRCRNQKPRRVYDLLLTGTKLCHQTPSID
jgi:hypothetical protein